MEKIITLLVALGVENAAEVLSKPENIKVEELQTKINEVYRIRLENSPEPYFKDTREAFNTKALVEAEKRVFETTAKAFGLDPAKYAGKTVADLQEIAAKRNDAGKDEQVKNLQADLMAANNKVQEYETKVVPDLRKQGEVNQREFDKKSRIFSILNAKGVNPDFYPAIIAKAMEFGKLDYNHDIGTLTIASHSGGSLMNKLGTQLATPEDFIHDVCEKLNILPQSAVPGTGGPATPNGQPYLNTPPGMPQPTLTGAPSGRFVHPNAAAHAATLQ